MRFNYSNLQVVSGNICIGKESAQLGHVLGPIDGKKKNSVVLNSSVIEVNKAPWRVAAVKPYYY